MENQTVCVIGNKKSGASSCVAMVDDCLLLSDNYMNTSEMKNLFCNTRHCTPTFPNSSLQEYIVHPEMSHEVRQILLNANATIRYWNMYSGKYPFQMLSAASKAMSEFKNSLST